MGNRRIYDCLETENEDCFLFYSEQTAKVTCVQKVFKRERFTAQQRSAPFKKTNCRAPKVVAKNMVLQGLY